MKPAPTGDVAALRQQVRDLTGRWRAEGRYVPRNDSWLRGFDLEFSRELASLGLIGLTWPVEYGGAGLPNVARLAVTEELLRAGAPVAAHWIGDRQIGPSVLRHGSPPLRAEILPGIISADFVFCLGMSEPEAGSDLASVRTFATSEDGGWRVRGRKVWTSAAHRATHAYLLARTERTADRHHGLTEFIVDMDSPGTSVSPIVDLTGEHHFNEVVFDDVLVPGHRVLGQVGHGWPQVVEQLSFERGGPERFLSSYALLTDLLAAARDGRADVRAELGELTARLTTREQFGQPLVRIPAVAASLAMVKASVIQCDAALARASGGALAAVAAARIIAGHAATQTARIAHQLHGAVGVTAEYRLHLFTKRLWAWRDAETTEHEWSVLLGELAAAGGEAVFWDELTA
jgi:acyl-CoA dehydrogenase